MPENFPNFTKTNTKPTHKPTDSRRWENLEEETPKEIYTKTYCKVTVLKTEDKENILKEAKEK